MIKKQNILQKNHFNLFQSLKKQNLQYILLNQKQMVHNFSFEQILNLFLIYCTFWKSSFCNSIQERQQIAQSVKKYVENYLQNALKNQQQKPLQNEHTLHKIYFKGLKYLNEKYLPQEKFITQNCKHMVWMYAFLLEYCLNGFEQSQNKSHQITSDCQQNAKKQQILNLQNLKFKIENLLLVLKDCIFLQFQYYYFTNLCFQRFFLYLVETKDKKILTKTIIECFDLIYLTEEHFLVSKNSQATFKEKYLRQNIKGIFMNISQKLIQREDFDLIKNKLDLLCNSQIFLQKQHTFDEMLVLQNRLQLYESYFNDLFNQIEIELQQSCQDIKCLQLSQKARYLIKTQFRVVNQHSMYSFQQTKQNIELFLQKLHLGLNVIDFMDNKIDKKVFQGFQQGTRSFQKIDKLINCQNISFYFFLHQRFNQLLANNQLSVILDLFLRQENRLAGFLNYKQFVAICLIQVRILLYNKGYLQKWLQTVKQIKRISIMIINQLSKDKIFYSDKIIQTLKGIDNCGQMEDYQVIKEVQNEAMQLLDSIYDVRLQYRINQIISIQYRQRFTPYSEQSLSLNLDFYKFICKFLKQQTHKQTHSSNLSKQTLMEAASQFKSIFYSQNLTSKYVFNIISRQQKFIQFIIHNRFSQSIMMSNFQFQLVKCNQKYWHYTKLLKFFQILTKEVYYFQPLFKFLLNQKNYDQLMCFILETLRVSYKQRQLMYILKVIQCLEYLSYKFNCQMEDFYATLFNKIEKLSQDANDFNKPESLLPLYIHILHQTKLLADYKQKDLWKKLLLKVYSLFPKYANFQTLPGFYNQTKKQIIGALRQEILHVSLKYVQQLKSALKKQNLLKKYIKCFYFQSYLNYQNIQNLCTQFLFYENRTHKSDNKSNSNSQLTTSFRALNLLLKNKRKMFVSSKNQYVFLRAENEFKRAFINLFNLKRPKIQEKLRLEQKKSQFQQKYQLISFSLYENFYRQNISNKSEKISISQTQFYHQLFTQSDENINQRIKYLKQSKQYQICEQNYNLLNQIINSNTQFFSQRLFQRYGKEVNQITWTQPIDQEKLQ